MKTNLFFGLIEHCSIITVRNYYFYRTFIVNNLLKDSTFVLKLLKNGLFAIK